MATNKSSRGKKSHADGHRAEIIAAFFLILKGYRILNLNKRTPFGEIDIVAAKGKNLIAVEVKRRADDYTAASAIHPAQQQRLFNALQFVAQNTPRNFQNLRCDAMLFVGGKTLPKHVKSAFLPH